MKKLILLMHTSLDGFVAAPGGEMDWITVDDAMFDFVGAVTEAADTAVYGRRTYDMVNGYWPTAGQQPHATKHDREHSAWYNRVPKIVLSTTLPAHPAPDTHVISSELAERIGELKRQPGRDMLMFGSGTAFHSLFREGLVDELWLFVNLVVLGEGLPLFKDVAVPVKLALLEQKAFAGGMLGLHYVNQGV